MTTEVLTLPVFRAFDSAGLPLAGGLLYTYAAGTTTPLATYQDSAGLVANTNPVVLDSSGTATVRLGNSPYKFVLKDSTGATTVWTTDNYSPFSYSAAQADVFTATAGQTTFTLSQNPANVNNLDVSLDGATLVPGVDYVWNSPYSLVLSVGAKVGQTLCAKYQLGMTAGNLAAGGTSGQILYNSGGVVNGLTLSGDVTVNTSTGVATVNAPGTHITYTQGGTGATSRTVTSKLQEIVSVLDFGADPTGAADSTTALLNFYNACINNGYTGHITAGTYLVTPGVLIFDNNFTDKAWPNITTDGHQATKFLVNAATETNTAVLTWKNGTASSGVGKFWRGGSHGGLTINGSGTGAAYTSQHHISLTGTWGIKFGWMASNNCKGNSFYCPQNLYGGTNPDPYANSFLHFDALESNFASQYGFYNANFVGMDSWYVENVRIVQPSVGGWYGIGSGNIINNWSLANVTGWAFDDGTYVSATGGSPQRNYICVAEFDNCQYGIRLNRSSRTNFVGVRFPTRFQTSPNVAALYWPLIGVDIAGGSSPNVLDVNLDIQWRVEAGGVLANLGTYIQTTANGLFNATVDWLDNGSLGITQSNFLSKCTLVQNAPNYITRRSTPVYDSRDRAISSARGSAATTVLNSGYASATSILAFPTQLANLYTTSSIYNTSTYAFNVPHTAWYRIEISIPMTVAAGTLIRLGVYDGSSVLCHSAQYAASAAAQTYELVATLFLSQGTVIYAIGNQNTGTASVACTPIITNNEVRFVVTEV